MRIKFDEQLALLNHELIAMGALCEEASPPPRAPSWITTAPSPGACASSSIR